MRKLIVPILLTLVLTACGGGGGGSSPQSSPVSALAKVLDQQYHNTIYNTAVGDLNNDGREDIVVSGWQYDNAVSKIWVFTQNTDGTLTDSTISLLGTTSHNGSQHVFIADFDNDGRNDIWLPGFRDGSAIVPTTSIMYWGSAGAFTKQDFAEPVQAHGACIDDVNSDGRVDLITSGGGIYFNNGNRSFTLDTTVLAGNNYFSACAVTHQANGDVNILLGNNGKVAGYADNVNIYDHNMTFQSAIGFQKFTAGVGDLVNAMAVDINNDGIKDFIATYNSNSSREVWASNNNTYTHVTTLDALGNDYYSYTTTVDNVPVLFFAGNTQGSKFYKLADLTAYKPNAFTDWSVSASSLQAAAVYRNTSMNKTYMLQLADNTFYSKEVQ